MFFCTRSRVWEALVNDAMTHKRHGGENKKIISPLWESNFHSYYGDWGVIYDDSVVVI